MAAVADGAGSASLAQQGAEIAVEAIVRALSDAIEAEVTDLKGTIRGAAAHARQCVLERAREEQVEPRELASTLLVVILGPDGGAALQIGDGLIAVSDGDERWSWVFWPQRGEYANTTHFLTDPDAEERWEVEELPKTITDLALMTDGLEPLALHYATASVHEPFLSGMLAPLLRARWEAEVRALSESLETFLGSERVRSRTDDDVSMVIATRRRPTLVDELPPP